jgi:hypothetical protein
LLEVLDIMDLESRAGEGKFANTLEEPTLYRHGEGRKHIF